MAGRFVVTPGAAGSARPRRCEVDCRGLHSYVADGRRVCWRPDADGRHAVDAELSGARPPDRLAARWREEAARDHGSSAGIGPEGATTTSTRGGVPLAADHDAFWVAWTRAEALAKLTDTPILVWLRSNGLAAPAPTGVVVGHHRIGDLMICTASAP